MFYIYGILRRSIVLLGACLSDVPSVPQPRLINPLDNPSLCAQPFRLKQGDFSGTIFYTLTLSVHISHFDTLDILDIPADLCLRETRRLFYYELPAILMLPSGQESASNLLPPTCRSLPPGPLRHRRHCTPSDLYSPTHLQSRSNQYLRGSIPTVRLQPDA